METSDYPRYTPVAVITSRTRYSSCHLVYLRTPSRK